MSFSWRFLVNLAAFWSPDAQGMARIAYSLAMLFSGFLFPLRMLPDWFARLAQATPFPALLNTPVEIFLGTTSGPAVLPAILFQFLWFLALLAAGQIVFMAGLRKLVVQGG